ncbi:unnamed protein product [Phytophthora fragariaefolia]|uniref:Unnamed protein product n=1 Tax=Phytophthora fragariaefolia TaxID=1490495 RepID=A0A9W6WN65_9STRA|nr:unnamed protein product [Phytophthora fragariaefolia]
MDAPARSEQEVLASLPPPPSALPDYPSRDKAAASDAERSASEASADGDVASSPKLPAKASSAARSMASKLAKSGRKVLSPLGKSPSAKADAETTAPSPMDAAMADPLGSVASLTSGLSSSLASASSSFGSLLFSSQSSVGSAADAGDERLSSVDRAAAEEQAAVLRQVSAQQRMRILEELVQHRRSDWNYLKAMHEGSNYWLNVALLREQQVMTHLGDKQSIRRGAQFFYLGIGLGRLLAESRHPELLAMDCCQLLEELEFYFSSSTVQGMVCWAVVWMTVDSLD